jgi:hypothetical protein
MTHMTMTRKRIGWGELWSHAPWDGKSREPAPIQIPATLAARVAVSMPVVVGSDKRVLRRMPLGRLLSAMPWGGRPKAPTLEPITASDELFPEALATL